MSKKLGLTIILLALILFALCCKPDKPYVEPLQSSDVGVTVDLSKVPYPKLSDYHFFKGDIKSQIPNTFVLPYQPISKLFTDYALKKRFIWIPSGEKANYISDDKIFQFPTGSVLIKTFFYDNSEPNHTTRIIETRLMIRKANKWIFAEYVWNENQTEAYLDMNGSFTAISWEDENGVLKSAPNYRIPSKEECYTCHKSYEKAIPIGPKPQNLNSDYTYTDGTMNQIQKWIQVGYLSQENLPATIVSVVDYKDTSQPLGLRVRSFLDINCAHCHQEGSHCDYRPIRLAFSETMDLTNIGVCVVPDENIGSDLKYVIMPQHPENSEMYFRLTSTDGGIRMPLLGRSIVDEEDVAMLKKWIYTLEPCH